MLICAHKIMLRWHRLKYAPNLHKSMENEESHIKRFLNDRSAYGLLGAGAVNDFMRYPWKLSLPLPDSVLLNVIFSRGHVTRSFYQLLCPQYFKSQSHFITHGLWDRSFSGTFQMLVSPNLKIRLPISRFVWVEFRMQKNIKCHIK